MTRRADGLSDLFSLQALGELRVLLFFGQKSREDRQEDKREDGRFAVQLWYLFSLHKLPKTVTVSTLFSPVMLLHSAPPAYPQFPLDTSPLRCVSAMPVEQIHFTLVYVLIPTRSAALRICSVPALAVQSPREQMRRTSVSGGCWSTTQQFS